MVVINYTGSMCSLNQKYTGKYRLTNKYRASKYELQLYCKDAMRGKTILFKPLKLKVSINYRYGRKGTDIDNYLKFTLDSMNGIVYDDDSQIFELAVTKEYVKKDNVGCTISIEEML